ncbi:hypothetical protein [Colwellia piezophila]|uniref:hypothetical protein n=1 Tax=Colwellia piezophila TaxID=211668 RepID=UPI0004769754|nr:hypothetical protein [Colwellia piezophila]
MMLHRLSFAVINSLSKDMLELIIDKNILVSIEMVEEFDDYIEQNFQHSIGILINKINDYKYSFEAKLVLGSSPLIQAVAILNHYTAGASDTKNIEQLRELDKLNMKIFSGLEFDRAQAIDWLTTELSVTTQNV